jgi:hypothetical protein
MQFSPRIESYDVKFIILDFKLSPCSVLSVSTFGCFPGVWFILADVSEPSQVHLQRLVEVWETNGTHNNLTATRQASSLPPPPHLPTHSERPNTWCLPPPLALPSRTNPDTVHINTTLSSHHSHFIKPLKMDLTEGSETSASINQTPGKHPKVDTLKFIIIINLSPCTPSKDVRDYRHSSIQCQY